MQGIRRQVKIQYLSELLRSENCVFGSFTESHLNPEILDAEVNIENYKITRADRKRRLKGGCCIYVRNDIMTYDELAWSNSVVDMCSVKLKTNDTLVINIYRPPDTERHENAFEEALVKLEEILAKNENNNIIITGDLNFPTIEWAVDDEMNVLITSQTLPKQAKALFDLLDEYCLMQCISKPTRGQNILDLVFTNNQQLISDIQINDVSKTISDHKIIKCESTRLTKTEKKTNNIYEKFDKLNFYSNNIKWENIIRDLENTQWDSLLENKSITEMYDIITAKTLQISETSVPQRKPKQKTKFCRERRNIWTKLKKAKDNIRKNKRVIHYKNQIESLEKQLVQSYIDEKEQRENDAISKIKENPRYFYKYANKHLKTKSSVGPLRNESNQLTDNDNEMCNLLQKQFSSVFSKPKYNFKTENFYNTQPAFRIKITEEDIVKSIDEMPNNTSSGPDTWPVQLLKMCKKQLAKPLAEMWQKSLDTGEIPLELLKANVTPIYKKGDKCEPSNYRPISLTSLIIKIIERIIRKHIVKYLEDNKLLNNIQHAFRSGRSCLSQLLNHFDRVLSAVEEGDQYDVIYTDYSKAFDKCDFAIICHKLNILGINHDVGRWIQNFLTHRSFCVIVNRTKSAECKVVSSVPQGTVLAPLLFIILINDIDMNISDCDISTFADDTKIGKRIRAAIDQITLQNGLNKLCDWTDDNNMQFNSDKFHVISYSCKKEKLFNTTYLTQEKSEIPDENEIKDLGVLMSSNMTFNSQILKSVTKAKQKIGWMMRTFISRTEETIITLYKSLVLPHVDYCSVLVSPHKISEIKKLEGVQRSMTFKITALKHLNYYERLKALKLYSLQRRRERYRIIYTWKIIEDICPNLPMNPITVYIHPRKGRLCMIPPIKTKSTQKVQTIKENTLAINGPRLFNTLPREIREITDVKVDSFKRALDKYLARIPDEPPVDGYGRSENSLLQRRDTGSSYASTWES